MQEKQDMQVHDPDFEPALSKRLKRALA